MKCKKTTVAEAAQANNDLEVAMPPSDADALLSNRVGIDSLNHPEEVFITTEELSRRLHCSIGTVGNWRKRGLPWINSPGRLILFSWPDVAEWLRRRQRGGVQ